MAVDPTGQSPGQSPLLPVRFTGGRTPAPADAGRTGDGARVRRQAPEFRAALEGEILEQANPEQPRSTGLRLAGAASGPGLNSGPVLPRGSLIDIVA